MFVGLYYPTNTLKGRSRSPMVHVVEWLINLVTSTYLTLEDTYLFDELIMLPR